MREPGRVGGVARWARRSALVAVALCAAVGMSAAGCTPEDAPQKDAASGTGAAVQAGAAKAKGQGGSSAGAAGAAAPEAKAGVNEPAPTTPPKPKSDDEVIAPTSTPMEDALKAEAEVDRSITSMQAFRTAHLKRLAESSVCAKDSTHEYRALCAVTSEAFERAPLVPLPSEPPVQVGMTVWVPTEGDVGESLVRLGAFAVMGVLRVAGEDAPKIFSTPFRPTDPGEMMKVRTAYRDLITKSLEEEPKEVYLNPELAEFMDTIPSKARHGVRPHSKGWQIQGGAFGDLRRVGESWVLVEIPVREPKGMYVTLFAKQGFKSYNPDTDDELPVGDIPDYDLSKAPKPLPGIPQETLTEETPVKPVPAPGSPGAPKPGGAP